MKKIKKFFKNHYKKLFTVLCVLISLFVFSFNGLCSGYDRPELKNQNTFQTMELKTTNSSPSVSYQWDTAQSQSPVSDYTQINPNTKVFFTFRTNKQYIDDVLSDSFMAHSDGYYVINFSFIMESSNLYDLSVYGFKRHAYNNEYANAFTTNYDYFSYNVNSIAFPSSGYTSRQYNISLIVPSLDYFKYFDLALSVTRDGNYNETVRMYTRKYTIAYYKTLSDLPKDFDDPVTSEQSNIINQESELQNSVDDVIGGNYDTAHQVTNPTDLTITNLKQKIQPLSATFDLFINSNKKINAMFYISLGLGMFAFVISMASIIMGKVNK